MFSDCVLDASCHLLSFLHLFLVDFLCLWNTHFQTLQAAKELPGRIYGQVRHTCSVYTHTHEQRVYTLCCEALFSLFVLDAGQYEDAISHKSHCALEGKKCLLFVFPFLCCRCRCGVTPANCLCVMGKRSRWFPSSVRSHLWPVLWGSWNRPALTVSRFNNYKYTKTPVYSFYIVRFL